MQAPERPLDPREFAVWNWFPSDATRARLHEIRKRTESGDHEKALQEEKKKKRTRYTDVTAVRARPQLRADFIAAV
jgi:hypothetical protein